MASTTHEQDSSRVRDASGVSPAPPNTSRISYAGLRLFRHPKVVFSLLKNSYSEFSVDRGTRMAASLAYYTIFSIAPLLVIAIAIAGLVFGKDAAQNAIAGQIQGFVGPNAAKMIQTMIQSAYKPAHGMIASVIGLIALLVGASGVFGEMQDALNITWDVNTQAKSGVWNLVKSRLLSYGMVLVIGFLLLVSLVVSACLAGVFKFVGGAIPVPEFALHGVELIVSLFVITVLFALLFKVLPDVKLTWNDVFFGAFTTAILFTIGKFAIGMYLGKSVSSSTYGAAGSVLLVISWVYYSAVILYFGAEFTHVYAIEFGSLAGKNDQKHAEIKGTKQAPATATPERIPELVKTAQVANLAARGAEILILLPQIIRSEIRLARAELKDELSKAARAGLMLITGIVLATYAVGFVLLTIFYALKIQIPAWIAAITVTLGITLLLVILVHSGRKVLKSVHLRPRKTAASLSRDVRLLKQRFSRSDG